MSLIEKLPKVRGRYRENASLAKVTWFQVGGEAEVLFKPEDAEDLQFFLANKPKDIPVYVIGVGSNLLVRDGGLKGVVIRLGRGFANIKIDGDKVISGAASMDVNVANFAAENGIGGLEFLVGVPGTIGGALAMNAGAYGAEVKDVLTSAKAIDGDGKIHNISNKEMGFSYRINSINKDWIFIEATFQGKKQERETVFKSMNEISSQREATQPIRAQTGGSTFKNPPNKKAWQLIDEAGCRGMKLGGAQVSEKHCNFLINTGNATASDIEMLGEKVREMVKEKSGVELEWEIKRIGTIIK